MASGSTGRNLLVAGVFGGTHDPLPTVMCDGRTVLLSPELAGVKDARYHDFVIGNVVEEPLPSMLSRVHEVGYVRESVQALISCAAQCELFDFCGGAQAGNRYFEHGSFVQAETGHCGNTRKALVDALHDISA